MLYTKCVPIGSETQLYFHAFRPFYREVGLKKLSVMQSVLNALLSEMTAQVV